VASNVSKIPSDLDSLLTIDDTRKIIPVGVTKIYEMIAAGDLETVRIGRRRYVRLSSVKRIIAQGAA
jgi:excisionase family DNA binding protein